MAVTLLPPTSLVQKWLVIHWRRNIQGRNSGNMVQCELTRFNATALNVNYLSDGRGFPAFPSRIGNVCFYPFLRAVAFAWNESEFPPLLRGSRHLPRSFLAGVSCWLKTFVSPERRAWKVSGVSFLCPIKQGLFLASCPIFSFVSS